MSGGRHIFSCIVILIAFTASFFYARATDEIYVAGDNINNKLGVGSGGTLSVITQATLPYSDDTKVLYLGDTSGIPVKKVATGNVHMALLTYAHKIVVLDAGNVGEGEEIAGVSDAVDVAAGGADAGTSFTAWVTANGKIYCDGDFSSCAVSELDNTVSGFTSVCAGNDHICGLKGVTGEVYCLGRSAASVAGGGDITWTKVSGDDNVLYMACGDEHTVLLARSTTNDDFDANTVKVFGTNNHGQCGVASGGAASVAFGDATSLSVTSPVAVAASSSNTFVIDVQGVLYGLGHETLLDAGVGVETVVPTALFTEADEAFESHVVTRIFAGATNALAIIETGQAFVWGSDNNVFGQDVSTTPALLVSAALGNTRLSQVTVESSFAVFIPEHACSWFSQYKQLDYDTTDSGFARATQGRRDMSVCGQCAGYGQSCTFNINPQEMLTGDLGRTTLGGVCEPTLSSSAISYDDQKSQGKYFRACQIDDWLLHDRRRLGNTPATDPTVKFRSDSWFPYPDDTGSVFTERVWPNLYARYHVTPPHKYLTLRIVVMTHDVLGLGDNIDLIASHDSVDNCHALTVDNYDYQSVRESNPWAIDVTQSEVETNFGDHGFCIAVYGDNQYPQKAGPSEYKMRAWWEPDFPNFGCGGTATDLKSCFELTAHSGVGTQIKAQMDQNIVRLGFADRYLYATSSYGIRLNRRSNMIGIEDTLDATHNYAFVHPVKGVPEMSNGFFWNELIYLKNGFETNFGFIVQNPYLCNSDDGFCGGGDGFVFFVYGADDGLAADELEFDCCGGAAPKSAPKYVNCPQAAVTGQALDKVQGRDLGVRGRSHMLAVEFDTWHNPDYYDPKQGIEHWWINATEFVSYADNHVAIFAAAKYKDEDGLPAEYEMILNHAAENLIAATPSIPDMSDGNEHLVKIWYLPAFGTTHPGTVTIFMDNMERPVLVGEITMIERNSTDEGEDSDITGTLKKWEILTRDGGGYVGFLSAQHDAPQDLTLTHWDFNRYPGRVAY